LIISLIALTSPQPSPKERELAKTFVLAFKMCWFPPFGGNVDRQWGLTRSTRENSQFKAQNLEYACFLLGGNADRQRGLTLSTRAKIQNSEF
jgi:hypothetical protein